MFRRTSKRVKEQVDKMRLPAVVCLCELRRDDYKHWRSTRPSLIEQSEIVMNKLPLMTAWCRITTLEVGGLNGFHGHNTHCASGRSEYSETHIIMSFALQVGNYCLFVFGHP